MAGVLAQALLGGVAGGAKQVNEDWKDRITRKRDEAFRQQGWDRQDQVIADERAHQKSVLAESRQYAKNEEARIYARSREDKETDRITSQTDAINLYRTQKEIDNESRTSPPLFTLSEDGKTMIPVTPMEDGSLSGVPHFKGGENPGFITQGKAAAGKGGSGSGSGSAGGVNSKQVAFFDAEGNMIDNAYVIDRGDGQFGTVRVGADGRQYFDPVYAIPEAAAPTDDDLVNLAENRNNPDTIADFNSRFGEGAAERALAALPEPQPEPTPDPKPTDKPATQTDTQPLTTPVVTTQTVPTFEQAREQGTDWAGKFRNLGEGIFGDRAEYYARKGDWQSVSKYANPTRYQELVQQYGSGNTPPVATR